MYFTHPQTTPPTPIPCLPSPAARRGTRLCCPVAARQCWALSGPSSSVVLAATSTRPRLLGSAAAAHSFPKTRSFFFFFCIVLFCFCYFYSFFFYLTFILPRKTRRVLKRNLKRLLSPPPLLLNQSRPITSASFFPERLETMRFVLSLSGLVRMFEFIHRAEMKNVYSLIKYIKVFCDALMSFHHRRATEKDIPWDDDTRPCADMDTAGSGMWLDDKIASNFKYL